MIKNLLFTFLAFFLFVFQGISQWGDYVGENVQLTFGEGLKENVLIVDGPENSWFISYTTTTSPNTHVLHLTRVSNSGEILWDNVIHDLSEVGATRAKMVSDMADGVIVSWVDRRDETTPLIYANRIDSDGNKLWGDADAQIGTSEDEEGCHKMISNGNGGAIITLFDDGPGGGDFRGIYAYGVESNGTVSFRTFLFPGSFSCENYSMCTDGAGGVIAFHIYGHVLEQQNQIRGMRLDENGTKLWSDDFFVLGELSQPIGHFFKGSTDGFSDPKLAYHEAAGAYLVYFQNEFGGSAKYHRAQLFDEDGNKQWDADDIIVDDPSELSPEVELITDLTGDLYFNYHTESDWELQKVSMDGSLPWTLDGLPYSSNPTSSPDNLAITTCNDVMISFDDMSEIIHAVRIDEDGSMVYDPAMMELSINELNDQHRHPVISVNDNDDVLVVWVDDEDINDSQWDLKMHSFNKVEGLLISNIDTYSDSEIRIYPNPVSKNNNLIIELSNVKRAEAALLSANGQVVFKENILPVSNGITRLQFSSDLNAGIYFLQLIQDGKSSVHKLIIQ